MPVSTPVVRALGPDDAAAARALGAEAFGAPTFPAPVPEPGTWPPPGLHPYGVHDDPDAGGDLVAKLTVRDDASWWGGAPLPTAGVAGVAVRPEHRGSGLLGPLVDVALAEARERGAVLSTLYATAPGIYRRFGYELVTELLTVEVPTAPLARLRVPTGVALHRATADDVDALARVYDAWAAAQNGPLTRRGPCWPDPTDPLAALLDGASAATLAEEDGTVTGYAVWRRPPGYDATGRLEVEDLVTTTPGAAAALLGAVGSFASVAPVARIVTSGTDVARLTVPGATWRPVEQHPYSLRLLDLPGACATRAVGPLAARVPFTVAADPHVGGAWVLETGDGRASCHRVTAPDDGPHLSVAGLALLWAGAQSCANLRMAGHLAGTARHDATLDALFAGRQVHVRDYF